MVRWQDRYSRQFRVSQGVRQGALLSSLFYATFVNDLLTILESHKLGISIGSVYCGVLAYADDFALISNDKNELQAMLDLCYTYSQDWHYTFNASKSIMLVFGESTRSRSAARAVRSWRIGDTIIEERDQAKHLGIVWSVS